VLRRKKQRPAWEDGEKLTAVGKASRMARGEIEPQTERSPVQQVGKFPDRLGGDGMHAALRGGRREKVGAITLRDWGRRQRAVRVATLERPGTK